MLLVPFLASDVALEHYITTGGVIVAAIVTTFGGVQVALIQSGRRWSRKAAERSAPTGNGFAKEVRDGLAELKANDQRHDQRLDDIYQAFLAHINKENR